MPAAEPVAECRRTRPGVGPVPRRAAGPGHRGAPRVPLAPGARAWRTPDRWRLTTDGELRCGLRPLRRGRQPARGTSRSAGPAPAEMQVADRPAALPALVTGSGGGEGSTVDVTGLDDDQMAVRPVAHRPRPAGSAGRRHAGRSHLRRAGRLALDFSAVAQRQVWITSGAAPRHRARAASRRDPDRGDQPRRPAGRDLRPAGPGAVWRGVPRRRRGGGLAGRRSGGRGPGDRGAAAAVRVRRSALDGGVEPHPLHSACSWSRPRCCSPAR